MMAHAVTMVVVADAAAVMVAVAEAAVVLTILLVSAEAAATTTIWELNHKNKPLSGNYFIKWIFFSCIC